MSPSNVAVLCRDPMIIKSVFSVFRVNFFEQSQVNSASVGKVLVAIDKAAILSILFDIIS